MFLRDLAVYASDLAVMPQGWSQRDFNVSTCTPVEAYLDRLPRRKVMLDDLAKVNVVIGPRPARDQPYWAALNVAIIYWPWFDFSRYFTLSRAEQQLRIIEILHKALLRIARRTDSSQTWYHEAYSALTSQQFPLPEISDYELRRRWGLLSAKEVRAAKRRRKDGRAKHRT